jgi:hypothetical protein
MLVEEMYLAHIASRISIHWTYKTLPKQMVILALEL